MKHVLYWGYVQGMNTTFIIIGVAILYLKVPRADKPLPSMMDQLLMLARDPHCLRKMCHYFETKHGCFVSIKLTKCIKYF
jgi:hypothetical protein